MSAAVLTSVTSTIQQSPARSAQLASAASTSAAALRELFELPEGEMLVGDFSCAIERTILLHGRAYLTQSFLCFASNIFGFETKVVLPWALVDEVLQAQHALVNPAIIVSTDAEDYLFTSFFGQREHFAKIVNELWQRRVRKTRAARGALERLAHSRAPSFADNATKSGGGGGGGETSIAVAAPPPKPKIAAAVSDLLAALEPPSDRESVAAAADGHLEHELTRVALPGCSVDEAAARLLLVGDFVRALKEEQGATEVEVDEWAPFGGGGLLRAVRCVHQIRAKLSPVRRTRVDETHRLRRLGGGRVQLEVEQRSLDIPYAEYFYVHQSWLLSPAAAEEGGGSELVVTLAVVFSRSLWLARAVVDSTVWEARLGMQSLPALAIDAAVGAATGAAGGDETAAAPPPLVPRTSLTMRSRSGSVSGELNVDDRSCAPAAWAGDLLVRCTAAPARAVARMLNTLRAGVTVPAGERLRALPCAPGAAADPPPAVAMAATTPRATGPAGSVADADRRARSVTVIGHFWVPEMAASKGSHPRMHLELLLRVRTTDSDELHVRRKYREFKRLAEALAVDDELPARMKFTKEGVRPELAAERQGALQVWLQHAVESRGDALALLHFLGLAGDRKSGW